MPMEASRWRRTTQPPGDMPPLTSPRNGGLPPIIQASAESATRAWLPARGPWTQLARLARPADGCQALGWRDRSELGREQRLAGAGPVVTDRPDQPQPDQHRDEQAEDGDLVGAVPEVVEQQEDD